MKPFDLEAAKRGDPVHMDARYTGWNYVGPVFFVGVSENDLPVVEIGNKPTRVAPDYLRMAPKKRTVYVNLYPTGCSWHFDSAKKAEAQAQSHAIAIAVPIEIED